MSSLSDYSYDSSSRKSSNFSLFSLPSTPSSHQSVPCLVADIDSFIKYLKRVIPALLEDGDTVSNELEKAFEDKENVELMKKFLADFSVNVLLVKKTACMF